jgi:hypothetical protein
LITYGLKVAVSEQDYIGRSQRFEGLVSPTVMDANGVV